MSPCFPRQSGLLVALAAGAWNSKVRSLRACRSCDGLCYMPSISIGEGERQGAQKNLPRQREVRELLQSDGLHVVELQGIHLETTGLGDELDGARAFGGVGVGAQHLVATVDVDLHGAAIHEHTQV